MLVVNNKRFNKEWLKSTPLTKVISVCTDTDSETITDAWNKANGVVSETKKSRKK